MSPTTERHRVLRIGILTLLLGLGMGLLAGSLYAQHRAEGVLAAQRGVILSNKQGWQQAEVLRERERSQCARTASDILTSATPRFACMDRTLGVVGPAGAASPRDADRIRQLGGALGALAR